MASTPEQTPGPGAPLSGTTARLAEQLHTLAQLGETLTYRLIELEERLAEQQERLAPLLLDGQTPEIRPPGEAAELLARRMGATEERLVRIEALLAGLEEAQGQASRIQTLPGLQARRHPQSPTSGRFGDDTELLEDPFDDEEEQPFMDERTA
jgi:hypothetical protein